ncbi:MAG: sulfite exporter TauE/SafE family protein, partial [Rickettsiales bacterium]|nr:sulfite exporter TauE/SafE family protein [Rickettsiales bacterium]
MQFILGQCHAAITQYPGVVATLFLAGLVGGVTHCAGMCGPFVASQVMSRAEHAPSLGRL